MEEHNRKKQKSQSIITKREDDEKNFQLRLSKLDKELEDKGSEIKDLQSQRDTFMQRLKTLWENNQEYEKSFEYMQWQDVKGRLTVKESEWTLLQNRIAEIEKQMMLRHNGISSSL